MSVISRTGVALHRSVSAALLVLAAGCGTTPAPAAAPVPVEHPTPASAPPPAPATPAQQAVGRTQNNTGSDFAMTITVLRLRQPFTAVVPGVLGRKGYVYAAVEVKACVTSNTGSEPISVSWSPWSLSYKSGVVVESASSYSPEWWDEPLYPQDRDVRAGKCVRGWIPFEVRASDGRPELVTYTPGEGTALEWTVAAAT